MNGNDLSVGALCHAHDRSLEDYIFKKYQRTLLHIFHLETALQCLNTRFIFFPPQSHSNVGIRSQLMVRMIQECVSHAAIALTHTLK